MENSISLFYTVKSKALCTVLTPASALTIISLLTLFRGTQWLRVRYLNYDFIPTGYLNLILLFGVTAIFIFSILTTAEIVVIKALYLYKYSRIAAMNEYFIASILASFNVILVASNIVIRSVLKEYEGNPLYNYGLNHHAQSSNFHKKVNLL